MKNAYQRFGKLIYVRRTEKMATNIRLHLDAFIGDERGKAHFVSVIGGDVEIGAIAAAFGNGDLFTVVDPTLAESIVSLGDKPLLFRGSIAIAGRQHPLRHLVAFSQELADTSSDGKLLLISDDDPRGLGRGTRRHRKFSTNLIFSFRSSWSRSKSTSRRLTNLELCRCSPRR